MGFTYEQTGALVSALVQRRGVDAVHTRLEPSASEMGDSVCQIHGNGSWLSRYPSPVPIFTQDLKSGDGLTEEKSDGPECNVNPNELYR